MDRQLSAACRAACGVAGPGGAGAVRAPQLPSTNQTTRSAMTRAAGTSSPATMRRMLSRFSSPATVKITRRARARCREREGHALVRVATVRVVVRARPGGPDRPRGRPSRGTATPCGRRAQAEVHEVDAPELAHPQLIGVGALFAAHRDTRRWRRPPARGAPRGPGARWSRDGRGARSARRPSRRRPPTSRSASAGRRRPGARSTAGPCRPPDSANENSSSGRLWNASMTRSANSPGTSSTTMSSPFIEG